MTAYSFQEQFVDPILVGLGREPRSPGLYYPKRHTIRAIGKRRHARAEELLQLYRGMRTRQCFKIGEARCTATKPIEFNFRKLAVTIGHQRETKIVSPRARHEFARSDGFVTWDALQEFWVENHADPATWSGVIIYWEPLT